jgi:hypothetical protein
MRALSIAIAILSAASSAALAQDAYPQDAYAPLSASAAQRRLQAYVTTWSTDQQINASTVAHYYADRVIYYGKPMSRPDVLRDKLRYISVWPERHYGIAPGTVSATCDRAKTLCRVSGIMQWDRRSGSGQRSVGSARLSLVLSKASGGKIVRESAVIYR